MLVVKDKLWAYLMLIILLVVFIVFQIYRLSYALGWVDRSDPVRHARGLADVARVPYQTARTPPRVRCRASRRPLRSHVGWHQMG